MSRKGLKIYQLENKGRVASASPFHPGAPTGWQRAIWRTSGLNTRSWLGAGDRVAGWELQALGCPASWLRAPEGREGNQRPTADGERVAGIRKGRERNPWAGCPASAGGAGSEPLAGCELMKLEECEGSRKAHRGLPDRRADGGHRADRPGVCFPPRLRGTKGLWPATGRAGGEGMGVEPLADL